MASSDDLDRANFKPDTTDKIIPDIIIRTNRIAITDVTVSSPLSTVPVFVRNLRIKAERGNKGLIYVGSEASIDLRNNGYPLGPGDELPLEVNDLSIVYVQGDTIGDALRTIYGS